jgi:hypothetical protein
MEKGKVCKFFYIRACIDNKFDVSTNLLEKKFQNFHEILMDVFKDGK